MEGKKSQFVNIHDIKACAFGCMLMLLVTATLSVGCASSPPPPMEDGSLSANPWEQDQPWRQADSSVLFTPAALDEMAWAGQSPDDVRWYDTRNDRRSGVYAGQSTQIVQQRTTTYSTTHLGSSNGRVYDNSYRHTHTRQVEEISR